ncbi:hypothetical protein D6850_16935 [Roseovarius spongiae]|uniref:Uncharacterized protein n=1 Tax=Roseovarius spongiae TaxID=2320272 RepID=A0A3A8ART7_9RHOB|nr:hypothetical protein [Roseovarius spongiae]RKF12645.1 hypothetical protein D6850_16935 [Roseovarius spongiae]
MWSWLSEHSASIQAAGGIVTAFIWIVYLQIFVSSFRRQRQSEILIYTGGTSRANPRIFVSNLGFESIYILEIMLTLQSSEVRGEASVIDRNEIDEHDLASTYDSTLQGPLDSGGYVDIGSLDDLLSRAHNSNPDAPTGDQTESIEIRVAAITAATSSVVAARREFDLSADDGGRRVVPRTLYAKQIRSWWGRRQIERELKEKLDR